ncbi:hypothetical protein NN561_005959 [Cricetulus griseus]
MPGTPSGSRASIRGTRAPLVLRVSPRRARWPRTAQRPPPRQGRVPGRGPAGGEGRPADAPRPEGACLASRTGSGPAHLQVVLGKRGVARRVPAHAKPVPLSSDLVVSSPGRK